MPGHQRQTQQHLILDQFHKVQPFISQDDFAIETERFLESFHIRLIACQVNLTVDLNLLRQITHATLAGQHNLAVDGDMQYRPTLRVQFTCDST